MSGTIRTWSPPHSAVERLRLFALHGTEVLGEKIARSLGCHLAALEERSFEDGEHKSRPLDTVAGCDVYVVHSLHGGPQESPNDKLCRLLSCDLKIGLRKARPFFRRTRVRVDQMRDR